MRFNREEINKLIEKYKEIESSKGMVVDGGGLYRHRETSKGKGPGMKGDFKWMSKNQGEVEGEVEVEVEVEGEVEVDRSQLLDSFKKINEYILYELNSPPNQLNETNDHLKTLLEIENNIIQQVIAANEHELFMRMYWMIDDRQFSKEAYQHGQKGNSARKSIDEIAKQLRYKIKGKNDDTWKKVYAWICGGLSTQGRGSDFNSFAYDNRKEEQNNTWMISRTLAWLDFKPTSTNQQKLIWDAYKTGRDQSDAFTPKLEAQLANYLDEKSASNPSSASEMMMFDELLTERELAFGKLGEFSQLFNILQPNTSEAPNHPPYVPAAIAKPLTPAHSDIIVKPRTNVDDPVIGSLVEILNTEADEGPPVAKARFIPLKTLGRRGVVATRVEAEAGEEATSHLVTDSSATVFSQVPSHGIELTTVENENQMGTREPQKCE